MSEDLVLHGAKQSLNPAEARRFSDLVDRADARGEDVIGMWLDDRQACMAGLVLAGRLIGWWMFSASSESAAQGALRSLKGIIELAIDQRIEQAEGGAEKALREARSPGRITRH